jgi:hypothetical protein
MGDGAPRNKSRAVRRSAAAACAVSRRAWRAMRERRLSPRVEAIRWLRGHHLGARVADDGDSRDAVRIAFGARAVHVRPDSRTIVTQRKKP